ncbi:MAG TPA: hypothetical protein PLK37_09170 [Terricaulis sp.]|nr:hypothetical protein [Terricaulis sp.]
MKTEPDIQSIMAQLARIRAELAALDNKTLTHVDEALRTHEKRERLTQMARELELRFAA